MWEWTEHGQSIYRAPILEPMKRVLRTVLYSPAHLKCPPSCRDVTQDLRRSGRSDIYIQMAHEESG